MGWEKFHPQAIQRVETHCGNCAKDTADHKVHGGAVDEVDEEGGAATKEHGEDKKELSSELVHVENGPEVAWPSRDGDDETVDEDGVIRNVFFAIDPTVCCFNLHYFSMLNIINFYCNRRLSF